MSPTRSKSGTKAKTRTKPAPSSGAGLPPEFTGGCLCGAVRYRAAGPVTAPTLCHCGTCRRAAGAPVVAWVTFPAASFAFLAAEPVSYRSSVSVVRTFCGRCGTSLTYARADHPDEIDVTTCSLDDPEALPPRDQTWVSHRVEWMRRIEGLPEYPATRVSS